MDIQEIVAQRDAFHEERALWEEEQRRADTEHEQWLVEKRLFEQAIADDEARVADDDDHEDRARLADLIRELTYDEKRLDLLYLQVAEGDERWLLECDALNESARLRSAAGAAMLRAAHDEQCRIDREVCAELEELRPAALHLEHELKGHQARLDHWQSEELRLDYSPSRPPARPAVQPSLQPQQQQQQQVPAALPERSASVQSQDAREAERQKWAEQRALLKERLRKKGRKSDPLSLCIEGGDAAVAIEGEPLPRVTVRVTGMPDVPVALCGVPPLQLQGETVKLLAGGAAVFDDVYVGNFPAAQGEVYVCYPRVGRLRETVATASIALRSSLSFNVWERAPLEQSMHPIVARSELYDEPTSLIQRPDILSLEDVSAVANAVLPATGERLAAFGGSSGVKLAYHTGTEWDITITLRTSAAGDDPVDAVALHPHYVAALTRTAGLLLWERKLVDTWRGHTTALPVTTVRHRAQSLDRLADVPRGTPITCIAIDSSEEDSAIIVCGGAWVVWWRGGRCVKQYAFEGEIVMAAECYDGDVFVAVGTRVVRLSEDSMTEEEVYQGVSDIMAVAVCGTVDEPGYLVAVGAADGSLHVGGDAVAEHSGVCKVTLAYSGLVLISAGQSRVVVWDVQRRFPMHQLQGADLSVVQTGAHLPPLHHSFSMSLLVAPPLAMVSLRVQQHTAPPVALPVCCTIATQPDEDACDRRMSPTRLGQARHSDVPVPYVGVRAKDGTGGALCVSVTSGGPAEAAGLQTGHVVVGVGNAVITNAADFREAVTGLAEGVPVRVCFFQGSELDEAYVTPTARETADTEVESQQAASVGTGTSRRFFSRRHSVASSVTSTAPPPPSSTADSTRQRSKTPSRSHTPSMASRSSSGCSAYTRSVSPADRSASAASALSSASRLPPMPLGCPDWSAEELRQLSSESFQGTTPHARFVGFLKANGLMCPTPANESTLRSAVVKHLMRCRVQKKSYVNWWRLSRPPPQRL